MDPYEVLGIPRDADDETVKKAYRELIKKYHPDRYINSPLADMASEKTKEINRAYDMINGKNTDSANSGQYGYYGNSGRGAYNGTDSFASVRILLTMNRTYEAESMLNRLPKNAEWYYLMGVVCLRKGWYDRGVADLRRAVELEPNNIEYRNALENILRKNTNYTTYNQGGGYGNEACYSCETCPFVCLPCFCPCNFGCCC